MSIGVGKGKGGTSSANCAGGADVHFRPEADTYRRRGFKIAVLVFALVIHAYPA